MTPNKDMHLNEDQILTAIVDEADLAPHLREHLLSCHQCMEKRLLIESDCARLGRTAIGFAPLPKRRFRLKAGTRPRAIWLRSRGVKAAFGLAAAAIFVFFVIEGQGIFKITRTQRTEHHGQNRFKDEELMKDIRRLSENALPREYMDIIPDSASDSALDDGFMEFIAPSI